MTPAAAKSRLGAVVGLAQGLLWVPGMKPLLFASLFWVACVAPDEDLVAAGGIDGPEYAQASDGKADGAAMGRTVRLQIDHPAFTPPSGKPGVVVYVPRHFDATPPVNVVVFLHGFYNCVDNVLGTRNTPCRAGGPARQAYSLAAQLEATHKNALLILPETTVDAASSDPGRLGDDGGFATLLDETLTQLDLGIDLGDVGRVVVATHSGGHHAAASIAQHGGIDVSELYLLDSLYAEYDDFDAWVQQDPAGFGGTVPARRFASVYSQTAGTLVANQAMATRAKGWVSDAAVLVDDRTTNTLSDGKLGKGLVWKRSGLSHDGIPRYYFGKLLATSGLR